MLRILCLLLVLSVSPAPADGPGISVDGEMLLGKNSETPGVAAFLGVPFAAPPTGELRWRAPRKHRASPGIREAREFSPACMQTPRIVDWYRDLAELAGGARSDVPDLAISEDCLYLNIWTPEPGASARLPVMVYVHGGSNRSGWSFEPNYHGHVLAGHGVVMVSVAYRLGDFGFFAHPDLDDETAVANFGLWDLIAALSWVQEHIGKFGGDADRVTFFGESAGAENIVALMFAPQADGLFDRAILQSTAGFGLIGVRSLSDERHRGLALSATGNDVSRLSVAELRNLSAEALLALSEQSRNDHYHAPVADGVLISGPLNSRLRSGDFRKRSLIVGTNANENYASVPREADLEYLIRITEQYFPDAANEVLAAVRSESDIRLAADRIITAHDMLCPTRFFAASFAASGGDVWMYRFSRAREGVVGDRWGAYHGTELPYVFGTHDDWLPTTAADLGITRRVMNNWARFAASGNPDGRGPASWPRFSAPEFHVRDIDVTDTIMTAPESAVCAIFENMLGQD